MSASRTADINGHEIDEHPSGRGFVVYVDCIRWSGSFESACAWAGITAVLGQPCDTTTKVVARLVDTAEKPEGR